MKESSLPDNTALTALAAGLATAHRAYGNPKSAILFIVQDDERNAFDQRLLEYTLLER
jgi:glutathione synthase